MSERRGAPPPPRPMPVKIPVVPWSTAPPPIPPRSFSTEPPPLPPARSLSTEAPPTNNPPSEPTLVRHEPIDARAFMMDPQRAEEIRDEARGLVSQAVREALAPLHFRVNELERRIEAMERTNRAVPPAPITTPQVAPRAVVPPPPAMPAYPAAYPALQPAPPPMVMAPMANAVYAPADPYSAAVSLPRPPAISTFDGDLPFDGARRKRKVLVMFAFLFLALLGGLLVSMAMSYSHPH